MKPRQKLMEQLSPEPLTDNDKIFYIIIQQLEEIISILKPEQPAQMAMRIEEESINETLVETIVEEKPKRKTRKKTEKAE